MIISAFVNVHKLETIYVLNILLASLTLAACFAPIYLHWKFDSDPNEADSELIFVSMNSIDYRYSLVFCMAMSVPLWLSLFSDILFARNYLFQHKGNVARFFTLFVTCIPDLIIFLYVIPSNSPAYLVPLFHFRNIGVAHATSAFLSEFGSPVFRSFLILLVLLFVDISTIFTCYASYIDHLHIRSYLYIVDLVCKICALLILFYLISKWYSINMSHDYQTITRNRKITSFLIPIVIFAIGLFILDEIYGPYINATTSKNYFVSVAYLSSSFVLSISVLHERELKIDIAHFQVFSL